MTHATLLLPAALLAALLTIPTVPTVELNVPETTTTVNVTR
jgi:hypothetical protein